MPDSSSKNHPLSHPKVFISYSHDSQEHENRVLRFSEQLRADGIDTMIDQYDTNPKQGWPLWMEEKIEWADFVVMICTEIYLKRVRGDEEPDKGLGVCWEAALIRNELYIKKLKTDKFLPALFKDGQTKNIPMPLAGHNHYQIETPEGYEALYRVLTKQPLVEPGILGEVKLLPQLESKTDPTIFDSSQRGKFFVSKVENITAEIKQDTAKIIQLLEDELGKKNEQITFLQTQLSARPVPEPSERAQELAAEIPEDSGHYALALKAVAERRFNYAHELLEKAEKEPRIKSAKTELSKIYSARGDAEYYEGRYAYAFTWYQKALHLMPDDPEILNNVGIALHYGGKYKEAEPLYKRALEIREKALGPDHPDTATCLNNLALLYRDQGKYEKAEPLYKRALEILKKALGKNHPNYAIFLQNYALLLRETDRKAEAEKLEAQASEIRAKKEKKG